VRAAAIVAAAAAGRRGCRIPALLARTRLDLRLREERGCAGAASTERAVLDNVARLAAPEALQAPLNVALAALAAELDALRAVDAPVVALATEPARVEAADLALNGGDAERKAAKAAAAARAEAAAVARTAGAEPAPITKPAIRPKAPTAA
jgi:hypothetical protein